MFDDFPEEENEEETVPKDMKPSGSSVPSSACPSCKESSFYEQNSELICKKCQIVVENLSQDTSSWLTFSESNNTDSHISGILPDLSSNIKMDGFGSSAVRRMYRWTYVKYFERTLIELFNECINLCTIYEIRLSCKRTGTSIPEDTKTVEEYKLFIDSKGIKYERVNKRALEKTLNLYKLLCIDEFGKKNFCHRKVNKIGIVAMLYYYINKEYDEYYQKKHLAKIFGVDQKTITNGNNKINKVIKKDVKMRALINKTPIQIEDLLKKLDRKFPLLSLEELKITGMYCRRIQGTELSMRNAPVSILVGVLMNLIKKFKFSLTEADLIEVYCLSSSTLNKYEKKLKGFF